MFRLLLICLVATATPALADIYVMSSGGFSSAYKELAQDCGSRIGQTIHSAYGASMGAAPDAIPNRLARGEPADVFILASGALDKLIAEGKAAAGSRVDLARSRIGMVVRAGAPKPDISTVERLREALRAAPSIAYSASASGVYLSEELFPKLDPAIAANARKILSERVAAVVARGEAAVGFQQISELLPVAGIDYVGPLPDAVQRVTIFSAGVATAAKEPEAAKKLIACLSAAEAAPTIAKTGLEPIAKN